MPFVTRYDYSRTKRTQTQQSNLEAPRENFNQTPSIEKPRGAIVLYPQEDNGRHSPNESRDI